MKLIMKLLPNKDLLDNLAHELPLGWSQLAHKKVRFAVALAGIGFANVLIFMQLGFSSALFDGVTRIHDRLKGDLFLVSKRSRYLGNRGFPRSHLYQAAAVDKVASARPFYYALSGWRNPENRLFEDVGVIAFNPSQPIMDLPEVEQQMDKIAIPDAVLFDRLSQSTLGPVPEMLAQGTRVTSEINKRKVTASGTFSLGGTLFKSGHVVTSDWNYLRIFGKDSLDEIQVGVIAIEPGADIPTVQRNIKASVPEEILVLNRKEFVQVEINFWSQHPAGVIFGFGTIMGFIVGVVVVYQVLYSDVSDHLPEYATLKAMGYSNRRLLGVVFQEAVILAVCGFVPGCIASLGMYAGLSHLTKLPVNMRPHVATQVFVLTVSMCTISAAIASRKLQSADPADVF
jgi:putative ABC transport system permease protein